MNVLELRSKLSEYKKEKQSFLNDTYLWVNMAILAINNIPGDELVFEVPSANNSEKPRSIRRVDREKLVNRIVNKDIYNSAYVMMISSVEDYYNKIMKILLKYDNNRIKYTMQGINMQSNIGIIDFLNNDKDVIIENVINQRIESLFYASPKKQLEYLDNALGISLNESAWYIWIEYKARRDVIVHNDGIINDVYMEKVNGHGQFLKGMVVSFDKEEFSRIVSKLKSIVGEIDRLVRREYHIPTSKEVRELTEQEIIN